MGLRDLAPGGYKRAKSMYGFDKTSYATLCEAAEDAVNRIYTAGMMINNRIITPGGNNIMADFAADAFDENDLQALELNGGISEQFADIIRLRQELMKHDNYYTDTSLTLFRHTYGRIQLLKQQGWTPENEIHQMNGPRPV